MIELRQPRDDAGVLFSAGALPPPSPIVVYSQRENAVQTWTRRMHAHPCLIFGSWRDLEPASASAGCLLIDVADLRHWPHLPQLRELRRDPTLTPLVIVTDRDPDNLRSLAGIVFTEVCWTHSEADRTVDIAIGAAQRSRIQSLLGRTQLRPMAHRAAEMACHAERPFRSVKALAGAMGVDRRRLWLEWRKSDGQELGLPLHEFVRWLLLVRVVLLKRPGVRWAAVAQSVGVHERTVFRLAETFLNVSPRELSRVHPAEALVRFRHAFDPNTSE